MDSACCQEAPAACACTKSQALRREHGEVRRGQWGGGGDREKGKGRGKEKGEGGRGSRERGRGGEEEGEGGPASDGASGSRRAEKEGTSKSQQHPGRQQPIAELPPACCQASSLGHPFSCQYPVRQQEEQERYLGCCGLAVDAASNVAGADTGGHVQRSP